MTNKSTGVERKPHIPPEQPTEEKSKKLHLQALDVDSATKPVWTAHRKTPDKQRLSDWNIKRLNTFKGASFMQKSLRDATKPPKKKVFDLD